MAEIDDPVLKSIVRELRGKYRCHTIVLYGSRARGLTTRTSDYDVVGIRKRGEKTRIARKRRGAYWDVFVYAEKDLLRLGDQQLTWKNARVLHGDGRYGRALLRRIERHVAKPYVPPPPYEIAATKAWAEKQLERCRQKDIQGLYRRAEFLHALVDHYFYVRRRRFWGPKEGFAWIEANDPETFRLIRRALASPGNLSFLEAAASRVYRTSLDHARAVR